MRPWLVNLVFLLLLGLFPGASRAQSTPESPTSGTTGQTAAQTCSEEAIQRFNKGLAYFDARAWDAALAEFLLSDKLCPSISATKNAAVCLRNLNRLDEALAMLERLRGFKNLSPEEMKAIQREIDDLSKLVGAVVVDVSEPGANLTIEGRTRGASPLPAPLRVTAGSHVLRVYKPGFMPAEVHVDVAGGQSVPVRIQLVPLVQSGWLQVKEVTGSEFNVVVDNTVVGKTPWRGLVPPGEHVVLLREEGKLGTQPASVSVKLNQVTDLLLLAEELSGNLRIEPTPAGASVVIDGVHVGRGIWQGALRLGVHQIEVTAEGFVPEVQEVTLGADAPKAMRVVLEAIPGPPLWWVQAKFFVEADGYFGLVPSLAGDIARGCTEGCSTLPGTVFATLGRAGYRLPSGILLAVEAGYLVARQPIYARTSAVKPTGLASNAGKADDTVLLRGALVGISPGMRLSDRIPLTLGLGMGGFFGTVYDRRMGKFKPRSGPRYEVDVSQTLAARGLYIAPEVRIGAQLGERLELGSSLRALVLVLPSPPSWVPEDGYVVAGYDGQGQFPDESLSNRAIIALTMGIMARYEF